MESEQSQKTQDEAVVDKISDETAPEKTSDETDQEKTSQDVPRKVDETEDDTTKSDNVSDETKKNVSSEGEGVTEKDNDFKQASLEENNFEEKQESVNNSESQIDDKDESLNKTADSSQEEMKHGNPEGPQTPARDATPQCVIKESDVSNDIDNETNQLKPTNEITTEKPEELADPQPEQFSDSSPSVNQSPEPQRKPGQSRMSQATMSSGHLSAPPQNISVVHRTAHPTRQGVRTSLTLNQMAIAASAKNKLPVSRLNSILERVGRHTESSAKKRGNWYKSETSYVDVNSYSWKNLSLYKEYQQQMWKGDGTIKTTCKK